MGPLAVALEAKRGEPREVSNEGRGLPERGPEAAGVELNPADVRDPIEHGHERGPVPEPGSCGLLDQEPDCELRTEPEDPKREASASEPCGISGPRGPS
eukprot:5451001-Lingulodinium_polyedra.AAC.1